MYNMEATKVNEFATINDRYYADMTYDDFKNERKTQSIGSIFKDIINSLDGHRKFREVDTNRDGVLSKDEIIAERKYELERKTQRLERKQKELEFFKKYPLFCSKKELEKKEEEIYRLECEINQQSNITDDMEESLTRKRQPERPNYFREHNMDDIYNYYNPQYYVYENQRVA